MNKIIWLIKQLFPLNYYSHYKENNKERLSTWKMFFGKCYNIKKHEVI